MPRVATEVGQSKVVQVAARADGVAKVNASRITRGMGEACLVCIFPPNCCQHKMGWPSADVSCDEKICCAPKPPGVSRCKPLQLDSAIKTPQQFPALPVILNGGRPGSIPAMAKRALRRNGCVL